MRKDISSIFVKWMNQAPDRMLVDSVTITPSSGQFCDFPEFIHGELICLLKKAGYGKLYSHQLESFRKLRENCNILVTTGTASGKSLCYQIPILNDLLNGLNSSSLLLFPTKALASDQQEKIVTLTRHSSIFKSDLCSTYDGDTPVSKRRKIIDECRILISNPDMLHLGIMPHHTSWQGFFSSLRFVILDEIHNYRGIFGSHVANVVRRLRRLCDFYGSKPLFILTSATIQNSKEHARALIEQDVELIFRDGSPHGKKTFYLINPPLIDIELGIRKSSSSQSLKILDLLLTNSIQTILFTITRRSVEVLLRNVAADLHRFRSVIVGYRSGYLPETRHQTETKLKTGEIKGVISTNALELGIDIGGLDAVIINGYPGTIASVFQQIGRAGRNNKESLAILVASQTPMDQYCMLHPELIKQGNPEAVQINPDNKVVLLEHIRAAIFELPFDRLSRFGDAAPELIQKSIEAISHLGEVYENGEIVFWIGAKYPAAETSLRNIGGSGYSLIVTGIAGQKSMIGTIDESSVDWMTHPQAVYLHEGTAYMVENINRTNREIALAEAEVDYYTSPIQSFEIKIITDDLQIHRDLFAHHLGTVNIVQQVTGYKKILWETQQPFETIDLELPASEFDTISYWIEINHLLVNSLLENNKWNAGEIDYGPDWEKIRSRIRSRDQYRCQHCGVVESTRQHHVHHKKPFRTFSSAIMANVPENLVTLCSSCHRKAEASVYIRSGLSGLGYLFHHLSSLLLLCDLKDIGVSIEQYNSSKKSSVTLFMYDVIPGGTGLSETLFHNHEKLLRAAYELLLNCGCVNGCPSCVGPVINNTLGGKAEALAILEQLLHN